MHNLEYFCKDAVDKKTDPEVQYYKVDDTSPWIEKYMFGSYLGDCPNGTDLEHGDCYVADNGESGVTIEVTDGGEICAVDDMYCYYKLSKGGDVTKSWSKPSSRTSPTTPTISLQRAPSGDMVARRFPRAWGG